MSSRDKSFWSSDIGRHVYQLMALFIVLMLVAVGYELWSHESLEHIERKANNYHLRANSHYLKAMEEFRKIQVHHSFIAIRYSSNLNPGIDSKLVLKESQHLTMHHLANKAIEKGLALEYQYSDDRFSLLGKRLGQQMESIEASLEDLRQQAATDQALLPDIDRVLITLEQLVRLHRITREASLEQQKRQASQQNLVFYILITVLLAIGAILSRRSINDINRLISEQARAEARIKQQAHFDSLTNLPNRFLALDRLTRMIKEARRNDSKIAVLFIDLDFFKKVNDMLGHVSGDKLLIQAAQRISNSVRDADTVGRLGGDEFIVLIGGVSSTTEVDSIAEKLTDQISDAFHIDGKELVLSASIGISIYPEDGSDRLELIRKADSAMYHSKEMGRNTYSFFTESMNQQIERQLSIEGQFHGALERNELEVYYQQKIDIGSNRIVGAEALLRWNNQTLGAVSPDEFIPIAEQTGLIVPVGQFVLTEALKMAHQWQQELAPDFSIAVNLSPRQFRDPDLINSISKTLHETEVASHCLELEITEGALMNEHLHVERALAELTRLGIKIAMDDFGTGYSSLNYLRNFPFDVIKIDRSFIQDVDSNSMSEQLNHAAISMAHALNISVVAEGVETESQLKILQNLGCDTAQGYYFGKPVPAREMTALLASHREGHKTGTVVDIGAYKSFSPQGSEGTK
ncbi:MAG: EAL domain-containing protein [Gammaproteobacteria bacterium]|nr:EAL domain-containing protein [Gammaproteobacteria bacterium]